MDVGYVVQILDQDFDVLTLFVSVNTQTRIVESMKIHILTESGKKSGQPSKEEDVQIEVVN